ncbi:caspase domain-containing protein [Crassisporium funariophilum]|nr:caspase domain-containing protein [Crassisporium funariophilum]
MSGVIQLDLSRHKLLVKPDDPLPRFYPPPRAIMVVPIYDTPPSSVDGSYRSGHRRYAGSDRDSSIRSAHRSPQRAVYTDSDSDYRGSQAYIPSPRSSSHGYRRTYAESPRRHQQDYDSDPYYRHDSRDRYPDSDSYLSPTRSPPPRHSRNYDSPSSSRQQHRYSPQSSSYPDNRSSVGFRHSAYQSPATAQSAYYPPAKSYSAYGNDKGVLQHVDSGLLDDVERFLKLIPPAPDFCWSACTGRKKAVCIGINYVGQKDELNGCANDARHMRDFLINEHGFKSQDIMLLTDDGQRGSGMMPDRKGMFDAMHWLVTGAKMHDSLFFHYSGHGGQVKDDTGMEADGLDEVIFPVDFKAAGDIIDDDLHKALVDPLPSGCRLTAVFDSCHSGTVLDLPYLHSAHGRLRGIGHISKRARQRGVAPHADVVSFAACKDDETSADTFHGGVAAGAMSYALLQTLKQNPHQTYEELLRHLRTILIPKYGQKAQLSGTHPIDLNRQFIL